MGVFMKNIYSRHFKVFMFVFAVLLFSGFVSAERVSITDYQEGNTYILGMEKDIDTTIGGDLFLLSARSFIQGTVNDDLNAISGEIRVQGVIGDDLRLIAGEADVNVYVFNELRIISDSLVISNTTVVKGSSNIKSSNAKISGLFHDSVKLDVENLELDAVFEKDLVITGKNIVISSGTKVLGDLTVPQGTELPEGLFVAGEIVFEEKELDMMSSRELFVSKVTLFLILAILASFIQLIFGNKLNTFMSASLNKPLLALVIGIVAMFAIPLLFLFSLISILLAPIGFLLMFSFLILLLLTPAFGVFLVGKQLLEMFNSYTDARLEVFVGALALVAISFIPGVLNLAFFFLFALFLGTVILLLFPRKRRKRRSKK